MARLGEYVVCETVHAAVLHVRRGIFLPCGKQDSNALCGSKPAWDTEIPLEFILQAEKGVCSECQVLYRDVKGENVKTAEQIHSEVEDAVRQRVEAFLHKRCEMYLGQIRMDLQDDTPEKGGVGISPADEPDEYLAMRVRCVLGDMNLTE